MLNITKNKRFLILVIYIFPPFMIGSACKRRILFFSPYNHEQLVSKQFLLFCGQNHTSGQQK